MQGIYGWNPDDQSTGFRGMHNERYRKYYQSCTSISKYVFGIHEFSGEEFNKVAEVIDCFLEAGDPVNELYGKLYGTKIKSRCMYKEYVIE